MEIHDLDHILDNVYDAVAAGPVGAVCGRENDLIAGQFEMEAIQTRDSWVAAFLMKAARRFARIAQILRCATAACSG
jgi:hypothetical protein